MSELKAIRSGEICNIIEYEDCYRTDDLYYPKSEADAFIAELKENHKNEVDQLRMKIAGLEKLVETADKLLKPKGGFTIKDVTFSGVELEGIKTHKNEETK